ncbi:MAG: histidinol-phosphatase [Alphaproteobacteria bacterium]|nr:histidinol-phosphatase [Alphaproteobacteria bacterium]
MTDDLARFAALATRLADAARPISLRHFRNDPATETKSDASPVTIADRESERVMREMIRDAFPDHGVIGEEFGADRPEASHVWVLDPVDGTKSFVSGRQIWGSLTALCRDGRPIIGIIDCPAVDDRWVGVSGRPTTHNGKPCRVRPCATLPEAVLYATSPFVFEGRDRAGFERLHAVTKFAIFGNDCHSYGLVTSGWVDLVVEAKLQVYDWAALVPVAEGAGGVITDWSGGPLGLRNDGRVVLAGDRRAHSAALAILNG